MEWISHNLEDTHALAQRLARQAFPGMVIALWGELGAGKTAFVQGFARGLGVEGRVRSPSFAIVHVHEGRLALYHFDLYRLECGIAEEGFDEMLYGQGVSAIEWPGNAGAELPGERLDIRIQVGPGEARTFALAAHGAAHQRALEEAMA